MIPLIEVVVVEAVVILDEGEVVQVMDNVLVAVIVIDWAMFEILAGPFMVVPHLLMSFRPQNLHLIRFLHQSLFKGMSILSSCSFKH